MEDFFDMYDVLLLENWGHNKGGEVITVTRGVYNTIISMGKGKPVDDSMDVEELSNELFEQKAYSYKLEKEIEDLKALRTKPKNKKIKDEQVQQKLFYND